MVLWQVSFLHGGCRTDNGPPESSPPDRYRQRFLPFPVPPDSL